VKELEYLTESAGFLVKKIKPNFKTLGPRYGKLMKEIAVALSAFSQTDISQIESAGNYNLLIGTENVDLLLSDVEIITEDIPGWVVANQGALTVALDITVTNSLWQEGIARELINRIQNMRKDKGFEVTDKITITLRKNDLIENAIVHFNNYICSETLAESLTFLADEPAGSEPVELTDEINVMVLIKQI
jgi:isoleucyl-tRNA synthetase